MQKRTGSATMNLTEGPVMKTLLLFSLPFMASTLLQTLYSTVDTIVIGQYMGSAGLSGVSNGSQLMQMLYMMVIGFSSAGQVLIAQSKGAKDFARIDRVVGTLFYYVLALSLLLGAVCVLFCDPLLALLNTPPEAYDYARAYIVICGAGMIFTGFYNMFSAILRGMGDSKHPLIFVAIASVLNLVLDVFFIAVCQWGVAGAAYATIIGQAVSVVFCFVYLSRHSQEIGFRFRVRTLRFDGASGRDMIRIGIPMMLQSAAIQFSMLFVNSMVNTLGVNVSAAYGVTNKIRNIPGILTQGLSMGSVSMIGQNLGAGHRDRVDKTIRAGILLCAVICACFGVFYFCLPDLTFRMFTQDEAVLTYAGLCIGAIVIEFPAKSVMPSCNALINAQGFVKLSLIVAFIDAFAGRVFLTWLLGIYLNLGAAGFFYGFSLATYLTAIPGLVYYLSGWWKKRALL